MERNKTGGASRWAFYFHLGPQRKTDLHTEALRRCEVILVRWDFTFERDRKARGFSIMERNKTGGASRWAFYFHLRPQRKTVMHTEALRRCEVILVPMGFLHFTRDRKRKARGFPIMERNKTGGASRWAFYFHLGPQRKTVMHTEALRRCEVILVPMGFLHFTKDRKARGFSIMEQNKTGGASRWAFYFHLGPQRKTVLHTEALRRCEVILQRRGKAGTR